MSPDKALLIAAGASGIGGALLTFLRNDAVILAGLGLLLSAACAVAALLWRWASAAVHAALGAARAWVNERIEEFERMGLKLDGVAADVKRLRRASRRFGHRGREHAERIARLEHRTDMLSGELRQALMRIGGVA